MEFSSRFRFRDHSEMGNTEQSETESEISSVSSDLEDDFDLQSMTGKGIKHLCTELLELKAASSEEFHKKLFSNYRIFVRVFEEVRHMEDELVQLEENFQNQKEMVKYLANRIYLKVLSIINEVPMFSEPSLTGMLEDHVNRLSQNLDILMSENRLEEALAVLESEDQNFHKMEFEERFSLDELSLYNYAISERKELLALNLTLMAENPRIAASELQKALLGLCRLGKTNLATQSLLKCYHSRIETGIWKLWFSKSSLHAVNIKELARFVFSMISQAARKFVMIHEVTSPYKTNFFDWSCEETKAFATCFNQYVRSISELGGGLSMATQSLMFAMTCCTLLETQELVLHPYLINNIRPCMEEFLHQQIDHFKRVIAIFTATDAWVLGRYLVSGVLNERFHSMIVEQQTEYCLLTNSGWNFVNILQDITEDVSPLLCLQMEGSVLNGIRGLFSEYIGLLDGAIFHEINVTEKVGLCNNLAISLLQEVSVLANVSGIQQLCSSIARSILEGTSSINTNQVNSYSVGYQQDLDNVFLFIQGASSELRSQFFERFIHRVTSPQTTTKVHTEICRNVQDHPGLFSGRVPSATFQVLFLELRKIEKLAEGDVFESDWLEELLRELVQAFFAWISHNKNITFSDEENMTEFAPNFKQLHPHSWLLEQFVLDVQFLVEISKHGGYFSNDPLLLENLMKATLSSVGLDPQSNAYNDGTVFIFNEVIQRLLEIEKRTLLPNEQHVSILDKETPDMYATDFCATDAQSFSEDSVEQGGNVTATDEPQTAIDAEAEPLDSKPSPQGGSPIVLDLHGDSSEADAVDSTDCWVELANTIHEDLATMVDDERKINEKINNVATRWLLQNKAEEAGETKRLQIEEEINVQFDEASAIIDNLADSVGLHPKS